MIIRELCASERDAVVTFMLDLCERDRTRRFCRPMSDDSIRAYVTAIDWEEAAILGAFDGNARMVGLVELCDTGEIAVAVAMDHRERGVARKLMLRALLKARVLGKERVMLTCLTENIPMRRLARSVGLTAATLTFAAERELAEEMPQIGDVMCNGTSELTDNVSYATALYLHSCTDLVQQGWHAPETPDSSQPDD
jgi:RimJ/RimL family protein N-acetyltransferase